jgi:predicted permease
MDLVLALLVAGVLVARIPSLPAQAAKALDVLVIWFALPGLILSVIPALDFDTQTLVPVAVAWASILVLAVLVLIAGRMLHWSRRTLGTMLLVVPLGNTSFLGIPAVTQLLSPAHAPYALIHDQLGSFLALATYGTIIAARYGSSDRPTAVSTLGRILAFPPFVALVAAFVVRTTGMPGVLTELAHRAGDTLVPLTMLVVGMRLRVPSGAKQLGPLVIGLGLSMAVAPALVLLAIGLLGVSGLAWETTALEVAMPPMVTASVVAASAGLDEELGSALVGIGVLVAMVSLPFWAQLFG